jgi:cytochrome bd-type quinol oxidase subunit 1
LQSRDDDIVRLTNEMRLRFEELSQTQADLRSEIKEIKESIGQVQEQNRSRILTIDRMISLILWLVTPAFLVAALTTIVVTGYAIIRNETRGQEFEPWFSILELIVAIIAVGVTVGVLALLSRFPRERRGDLEYEAMMFGAIGSLAPLSVPMLRWVNVIAVDKGIDDVLFAWLRVLATVPLFGILVVTGGWAVRRVRNQPPEIRSHFNRWATPDERLLVEMLLTLFLVLLMITVNPLARLE